MRTPIARPAAWIAAAAVCVITGCKRDDGAKPAPAAGAPNGKSAEAAKPEPTNRVDIPASVRRNLGITFARVETRNVAQTLRLPGRFEYLPTARREYRTPLTGRVEILVSQFQRVEAGTVLYRIESADWADLHERLAAAQARVESMPPLRAAHKVHEESLASKVQIWRDRLRQLEELREAGGGGGSQLAEARTTLGTTQAELADVMEKDAELQANEKQAEAELRSLRTRLDLLTRSGSCGANAAGQPAGTYAVCAVAPGVVETIGATPGGLVETNGLVLSVVQPEAIRFRARGLQSDLGRLREGLPAAIAAAPGDMQASAEAMRGRLRLGLAADPDERTVDLMVVPESLAPWARAGVSAFLEVTLAGGQAELAIPQSAVVRDGVRAVIFRRDPANPDKVIRMEADLGISDGRWVVIASGVKEGDEVVLGGNFQLMLATSGSAEKGGHFHSDGTFHKEGH